MQISSKEYNPFSKLSNLLCMVDINKRERIYTHTRKPLLAVATLSDRVGQRKILTDIIKKLHALEEEEQEYRVESHVVEKSLKSDKQKNYNTNKGPKNYCTHINIGDYSVNTISSTEIYINLQTKEFIQLTYGIDQHEEKKIFTILATVNEIDDKFGWNYVECEKCHKKVYKKGDNYICGTCNQIPQYPTIRQHYIFFIISSIKLLVTNPIFILGSKFN
ncbi:hypothetical protein Ahy_A07g034309 [Arachis hypogaea]|uniref:Replication factor A C-terminal domain-containing protein n=1 Tax=Arachis hypogaea TaxID=3818 RepID=A0A445CBK1_ARAHY|nr:hypothetical protein Ahy_A07g034309 [Arachis hypogaea]